MASKLLYHANTAWLFTRSDIKTIVVPSAIFALANGIALSGRLHCLTRVAYVLLWDWLNLVPFTIGNQRGPGAATEDLINKPWRPLPSGRVDPAKTGQLLMLSFACALAASIYTGGLWQSLSLVFFDTWYNSFGGGDGHFLIRYFINACGYLCFLSGSLQVALPDKSLLSDFRTVEWFILLGAIIWTTTHAQDFEDQVGDRLKGRRTAPIALGDGAARFALFALVPAWTLIALHFWQPAAQTAFILLVISVIVAFRTVSYRTILEDKRTFRIWNMWIGGIFVLPLCAV